MAVGSDFAAIGNRIQTDGDIILPLVQSAKVLDYNRQSESTFGECIQIFVKTICGKSIKLDVACRDSIESVKVLLQIMEGIPKDQQRLVCEGVELQDVHSLSHYNIKEMSTLYLLASLGGGMNAVPLDFKLSEDSWVCPECTAENTSGSQCTVCLYHRPSMATSLVSVYDSECT
jgi:hypothetical protein